MKIKITREFKIILTVAIMAISVFFFIQAFPQVNDNVFHYQITHNTDYQVYLIPNDFIQKEYMEKNQVYLQNLVKYINTSFSYDYQSSQKEDINYNYTITATLEINYATTNQNLLKKEYPIIQNKFVNKENENRMEIKENIQIDYQSYYQEVQKFKEQFNLPVKAYVKINFTVNTGIKLKEESKKVSSSELTIDLSQPVFEIQLQESQGQQDMIIETKKLAKEINLYWFISGGILFLGAFIYLMYEINQYQTIKTTKFKIELNRILKKYDDIVVELKEEPDFSEKQIHWIQVKNFNELMDIEEEIREPILFYQKEEIATFIILSHNQIGYKVILKEHE